MDFFNFNQTPQSTLIEPARWYQRSTGSPRRRTGGRQRCAGCDYPIGRRHSDTHSYDIGYNATATPTVHNIIVDGVTHAMSQVANFAGGTSTTSTRPSSAWGAHSFKFVFSNPTGGGRQRCRSTGSPFQARGASIRTLLDQRLPGNAALAGQPVTYSATYVSPSGKAPTRAEVDIGGVPHTMTASGTSYTTGVTYKYTTSGLPIGSNYYRFVFDDGSGPAIYEVGSLPRISPIALNGGKVSPASGTTSTTFTYSVSYVDPAGHAATQASVCIGTTCHAMTKVSGTPTAGVLYRYTTKLASGSHTFAFLFADGTTSWTSPVTPGTFAGPTIGAAAAKNAPAPAPSSRSPAPDTATTTLTDEK